MFVSEVSCLLTSHNMDEQFVFFFYFFIFMVLIDDSGYSLNRVVDSSIFHNKKHNLFYKKFFALCHQFHDSFRTQSEV